jgi:hypothetical protein
MVLGLNGVVHITDIINPVGHGQTTREMLMPLLLLGFGTLGPWVVRAVVGGITIVLSCWQGMCVRVVPVDDGHWI